jgi:hypothetical protein
VQRAELPKLADVREWGVHLQRKLHKLRQLLRLNTDRCVSAHGSGRCSGVHRVCNDVW